MANQGQNQPPQNPLPTAVIQESVFDEANITTRRVDTVQHANVVNAGVVNIQHYHPPPGGELQQPVQQNPNPAPVVQHENPEPQNQATARQEKRIQDAFTEIAKKFSSIRYFKWFAAAEDGLALSDHDITTIIEENPNSVENQKLGMIGLWRQRNGTLATPRLLRVIVRRYLNDERLEGADKLQQFGKVLEASTRKSARPTTNRKYLATPDCEVNPKTVEVDFYGTTVKDAEYKPEPGFSQQTQKQPGEPISMENFFSDGKSRVAIIGGAGYGKTEMLKRYVTAVLDGKIPELKEVKFVLHLNFRDLDVEGKMTLGQFLFGHLDVSDDVIEAGLDHIKENAKIFLLAIDGADQYGATEHLGKPSKIENHKKPADPKLLLNSILSANLLDGIHVIYTSREHVLRYFKGEVRPERIIALAGFDEESVKELIRGLSGDQADDIMHHLETKAPGLLSLCSVPMFLVFTVFVLRAYKDTHNPETLTEVLLLVFDNAMKSDHISEDRREIIHEVLHQLKGVSFNCTRARKVTFTNQDLPAGINPDDFKDLLIPIPGKKGFNRTLIEKDFVYLPIHQSLQEALAALNIAEMNDIKEFEEFVSEEIHEPHWVVVRRILYGILMNNKSYNIAVGTGTGIMKEVPEDLLKKKRSILLSSLKERIKSTEERIRSTEGRQRDFLELIHLINECGDVGADVTSSIRSIILNMPLTQSDKYAVASVLGRCSRLDGLNLYDVGLTASDLSLLASSMQRSNIKIKWMVLGGLREPFTHDKSAAICNMLPHITDVMMLHYQVKPEHAQMIQRKLGSLPPTELRVECRSGFRYHWIKQSRYEQYAGKGVFKRQSPSGSGLQSTSRSRHYEAPDMPDQETSLFIDLPRPRAEQMHKVVAKSLSSGRIINGETNGDSIVLNGISPGDKYSVDVYKTSEQTGKELVAKSVIQTKKVISKDGGSVLTGFCDLDFPCGAVEDGTVVYSCPYLKDVPNLPPDCLHITPPFDLCSSQRVFSKPVKCSLFIPYITTKEPLPVDVMCLEDNQWQKVCSGYLTDQKIEFFSNHFTFFILVSHLPYRVLKRLGLSYTFVNIIFINKDNNISCCTCLNEEAVIASCEEEMTKSTFIRSSFVIPKFTMKLEDEVKFSLACEEPFQMIGEWDITFGYEFTNYWMHIKNLQMGAIENKKLIKLVFKRTIGENVVRETTQLAYPLAQKDLDSISAVNVFQGGHNTMTMGNIYPLE